MATSQARTGEMAGTEVTVCSMAVALFLVRGSVIVASRSRRLQPGSGWRAAIGMEPVYGALQYGLGHPTSGSAPTSAREAIPSPRAWWSPWLATPGTDLIVPAGGWDDEEQANAAARGWCVEVNGRAHSEIAAVPAERLVEERKVLRPLPSLRPPLRRGEARKVDKLSTVRFGSARYSVPKELVAKAVEVQAGDGKVEICHRGEVVAAHPVVAPGECSIIDDHYGGPRRSPARAVRPRSGPERAFLDLGPAAEAFLRAAAAADTTKLATELAHIVALEGSLGPRGPRRRPGASQRLPPLPGRRREIHPRGRSRRAKR